MTKTIELSTGQTAIVITPGDNAFTMEKYSVLPDNLKDLDPDEGADILFYRVLAVGLMHLAVNDTELVLDAGEEAMGAKEFLEAYGGYLN